MSPSAERGGDHRARSRTGIDNAWGRRATMQPGNRRQFLTRTGAGLALGRHGAKAIAGLGLATSVAATEAVAQVPGQRPAPPPAGVRVLNPRDRVPVSLIIDDSTCLVNL